MKAKRFCRIHRRGLAVIRRVGSPTSSQITSLRRLTGNSSIRSRSSHHTSHRWTLRWTWTILTLSSPMNRFNSRRTTCKLSCELLVIKEQTLHIIGSVIWWLVAISVLYCLSLLSTAYVRCSHFMADFCRGASRTEISNDHESWWWVLHATFQLTVCNANHLTSKSLCWPVN